MTTVNTTTNPIQIITVAKQGLPGPPGDGGPGFTARQGFFGMLAPIPVRMTLVSSQRYAYPLTGLYGCSTKAGQLRVTFYIDGVAIPGLDHVLITTAAADFLADEPAIIPLGGKLEIELSDIEGASGLELTAG